MIVQNQIALLELFQIWRGNLAMFDATLDNRFLFHHTLFERFFTIGREWKAEVKQFSKQL